MVESANPADLTLWVPKLTDREIEAILVAYLAMRAGELRRQDVATVAFVLMNVVESVSHASVLAELPVVRSRTVARELTDLIRRYLLP